MWIEVMNIGIGYECSRIYRQSSLKRNKKGIQIRFKQISKMERKNRRPSTSRKKRRFDPKTKCARAKCEIMGVTTIQLITYSLFRYEINTQRYNHNICRMDSPAPSFV